MAARSKKHSKAKAGRRLAKMNRSKKKGHKKARKKTKGKLTTKAKAAKARARKKSLNVRQARHRRRMAKRAGRAGLSVREYVRRENAAYKASDALTLKILNEQGSEAMMSHMFKTGQLY